MEVVSHKDAVIARYVVACILELSPAFACPKMVC